MWKLRGNIARGSIRKLFARNPANNVGVVVITSRCSRRQTFSAIEQRRFCLYQFFMAEYEYPMSASGIVAIIYLCRSSNRSSTPIHRLGHNSVLAIELRHSTPSLLPSTLSPSPQPPPTSRQPTPTLLQSPLPFSRPSPAQ